MNQVSFGFLSYLEKDMKTKCVVEMEENQTILYPPTANMNKGDPRWAAQLSFIPLLWCNLLF